MRINKLSPLIGLSAALVIGPMTTTQANDPGVYLGASWGAYSINESDLDDNDDMLKAVVGIQFNELFGVEGSWVDFKRMLGENDRFESDGKGLAAAFSMPVGDSSSAFVKAGQFWWDSNSYTGGVTRAGDGNDLFWGGGFKYGFTDSFAVRVDAERYKVASTHLNASMVGLEVKF